MIALTKSNPTTLIPTTTVKAESTASKMALNFVGIFSTRATSVSTPTANICRPQINKAETINKLIKIKAIRSELEAVVRDPKR